MFLIFWGFFPTLQLAVDSTTKSNNDIYSNAAAPSLRNCRTYLMSEIPFTENKTKWKKFLSVDLYLANFQTFSFIHMYTSSTLHDLSLIKQLLYCSPL